MYVHILKVLRSKLDPYAQHCVFVSYSNFQKGYRCYCPQTHKLHISLDVSFREMNPYYLASDLGSPLQGGMCMKKVSFAILFLIKVRVMVFLCS